MLQRRSGSACAVLGNQLVLLGGNDGTQASICTNLDGFSDGKDMQRFDFSEDSSIPRKRIVEPDP